MVNTLNLDDGTMDYFKVDQNETIFDHTKELREFYLALKKHTKTLGGSQIYEDLLDAYEAVGEEIAELKKEIPKYW